MNYSVVVPFNDEDVVELETTDFEQAKLHALQTAKTYGTACVVIEYRLIREKWLLETDGNTFSAISTDVNEGKRLS